MRTQRLAQHTSQTQRGSVLVIALVILSALLMAATLTILKVQRGSQANSETRFRSVALFAAESGASAGMDFLRANVNPVTYFSAFVSPNNSVVQTPLGIPGNTLPHLDANNLFSGSVEMDFEVSLLNNISDPGFATGTDDDGILIMRCQGRGPGTSMVILEVEIDGSVPGPLKVLSWRTIE